LAKSVPPPPARHFDPAPLNGNANASTAVVDLDGGNMKKRFENNIDEALSDIKLAAREPIRTPYSADLKPTDNELSANQFSPSAGNQTSGLGDFAPPTSGKSLSLAQQEFNAAMNQTSDTENDFAPKMKASNDFTTGWKDDIKLPTGLTATRNRVDQSLASVNESLQNANRRMGEVGSSAVNSFQTRTNEFKNNIQSNVDAAAKSANDFVARGQAKLNSAIKPITGIATDNNFSPSGFASSAGSSATSNQTTGDGDLELVQAQVAEAKQQIERLKMQVEEAKQKDRLKAAAGQTYNQNTLSPTPPKVAQRDMPAFKSAYTNPGSLAGPSGNASQSTHQPALPNSVSALLPQTPPDNFAPTYPSTAHGGFSPQGIAPGANSNFAPPMQSASTQAGFQGDSSKSDVVKANSQSPESDSASRIQNFVTEVDIPDSVLKGTGSYAPGSVNALRK
jgi:hypothetical protein